MSLKISEMVAATLPLTGTELVEIVQGGLTRSAPVSSLGSRSLLLADRTYYVRTDGSDLNDGLSNSAGGAFATVQKAIDVASGTLDLSIYTVTIKVGDGDHLPLSGGTVANLKPFIGQGQIIIEGNVTTPTNCRLRTGNAGHGFLAINALKYQVKGFKIYGQDGATSQSGITARDKSSITFSNIDFGNVLGSHLVANAQSSIEAIGNYSISGGSTQGAHAYVIENSNVSVQGRTVTLTGTPNFPAGFVWCDRGMGYFSFYGNTFIGSATGQRYLLNLNAVCFVNGAGTSYLPGSTPGTLTNGAQYA